VEGLKRPVQLALPIEPSELSEGKNSIVLTVGDGSRGATYDFVKLLATD